MRLASCRNSYRGNLLKNSATALFTTGFAALTVVSCSSGPSGSDAKPTPSKSSASKPAADDAAARKDVLAAYSGMRTEQVKAYAKGKASGTKLEKYATDKALATVEGNLFRYRQGGIVFKGKPKSSAKVTALSLSDKPKTATVTECLDTTHWKPVVKSSGKEAASGNQPRRYTVTGTVRTIGKTWMVVGLTADKDHPC
ncbi:hypothetical protein GCM10012285_60430 [Streptomyces kronopolitis]|uniref:Secreted protein/lipoprotein n=1 Tax=Streptomyces kronopolitis TaxID=1612435 RepID=A0ABQ2K3R9_9ACTN|nr:hypothetical protein [Streptomyces kronopolitis]GGN61469.1 hypothetical protein GCM10012285_60430 [Streptomyces kronopolitis]